MDQKEPQLVAEVVASKEQQILVSRWREEIKLAWAQKMAPKEALVVRLLVNLRTSCKVEDTCSLAVVLGQIAVKSRVQQGKERGR